MLLAETIRRSGRKIPLHLFDTFTGIPFCAELDRHVKGDFGDVTYDVVANRFQDYENVYLHAGLIPGTFIGRQDDSIALSYLDVDQEQSTRDCLEFVWPRTVVGGLVVVDDYDWTMCPGVRPVVDCFFHKCAAVLQVNPECQVEIVKRPN